MVKEKGKYFYKTDKDLRKAMKISGLTQEKFAKKIGVTSMTLRNWMQKGGVSYDTWKKVQEVLQDFTASEEQAPYGIEQEAKRRYDAILSEIFLVKARISGLEKEKELLESTWTFLKAVSGEEE